MSNDPIKPWLSRVLTQTLWVFAWGVACFLLLALVSYDPADPGWSYVGPVGPVHNLIGPVGAIFSDWVLSWFGLAGFFLSGLPIQLAIWTLRPNALDGRVWMTRLLGSVMWIPGVAILLGLHIPPTLVALPGEVPGGGMLGAVLADDLHGLFGPVGAAVSALILVLVGGTLAFRLHWPDVLAALGSWVERRALGLAVLFGKKPAPAQLQIGNEPSRLQRLLTPVYRLALPRAIRGFLSKVAPKPPEADVAAIEAELLGLSPSASPSSDAERQATRPAAVASKDPLAAIATSEVSVAEEASQERIEPRLDDLAVNDLAVADRVGADLGQQLKDAPETRPVHAPVIAPLHEAETLLTEEPSRGRTTGLPNASGSGRSRGDVRQPVLPDLSLLDPADPPSEKGFSQTELTEMGALLTRRLAEYGVEAAVVAINPGPVVTRFEISPAPGVKVARITNLAKDVARSLAVISVRVVEVIPGKSTVGIEIPNQYREMVRLSQILGSEAYRRDASVLTLALGHDISGQAVCANLAKMPHLLVAGTTGSGKSVGVNAMLLSMLYKARPSELRLILVDPKMLELAVYEGIPHLLAPVVTDMKDAANALRWCVGEMERRYQLMAALGVRNLEGFNAKLREAREQGQPLLDPLFRPQESIAGATAPELLPLPFIVVVIDEFADMMMIVGKKVDQLIARLAQKARAAGIHLILATQRPSVDVITGLIKANIPSRISFQVSSKIDSRTVLDQGGAEQLLGHGDMLYLPSGKPIPVRVHGAFVDDHEVHQVVNFWKMQGQPAYEEAILRGQGDESEEGVGVMHSGDDESDALYDEAVAFVTESRRASISAVQRKLKIGYNRAARMIEAMEAAGVVSEMGTNGAREVLAPPPR